MTGKGGRKKKKIESHYALEAPNRIIFGVIVNPSAPRSD